MNCPTRTTTRGGWRILVTLLVFATPLASQPREASAKNPNVVLILTDDLGYGDLGCYGAPDVRTPWVDRLARQGVRFTDFYAAPQCTPTRASLMTGRYQQRVRLERALSSSGASLDLGLPASRNSLPNLLKNNGYSTALIGKWHLGYKPEFNPNAHGFDYFFGFLSGYIDFYTHTKPNGQRDLFENANPVEVTGYMTDLITKRALRFIEDHRMRRFFLEVAYSAPHWPFQPPDQYSKAPNNGVFQGPSDNKPATRKEYVAMVERVDRGVGEILTLLDRLRLGSNTLVIFTNDNGGEWLSRNAPLFHRKDTLWEGGIRVPAILRWPNRLPSGKISSQVGMTMDLTATILGATGTRVSAEARLEGIDLLPILQGRSPAEDRTLFWRIVSESRHQRAVRRGDWKLLIDGDDLMLYNLRRDIGERRDLALERPDLVRALRLLIGEWESNVDAEARK